MDVRQFVKCYLLRLVSIVVAGFSISCVSGIAQEGATSDRNAAADDNARVRANLAFDVTSIRPAANTGDRFFGSTGDEYSAIGRPLGITIMLAYFPFRMASKDRIIAAPGWVWNDTYDFVGKVGEADLPEWNHFRQRGLMAQNPMLQTILQNALADRCKLVVHRVPTQVDGYALVVANHGPNRKNLVESKPDDVIPDEAQPIALDGRMVPILSHDNPVLHFYQTSMASFVLIISGPGALIEDKTGLAAKYRFDLTLLGNEGIPTSDLDLAPLGLKLVRAKIPAENIMIDHIEKPSPN
jgi:uncharacterized protein (TIGR03435 family)